MDINNVVGKIVIFSVTADWLMEPLEPLFGCFGKI